MSILGIVNTASKAYTSRQRVVLLFQGSPGGGGGVPTDDFTHLSNLMTVSFCVAIAYLVAGFL